MTLTAIPVNDVLVQRVARTIVERFHPKRIIVFGSYARGQAGPHSDLDMLVEMESDKPFLQRTVEVNEVFGLRTWPMDLLVYTPAEFAASRKVFGSLPFIAETEGKVVYERP